MFNRKLPSFQIIERQTYSIMAAARTLRTRRTFPQISGKTSLPDISDFRTNGPAHSSSSFVENRTVSPTAGGASIHMGSPMLRAVCRAM